MPTQIYISNSSFQYLHRKTRQRRKLFATTYMQHVASLLRAGGVYTIVFLDRASLLRLHVFRCRMLFVLNALATVLMSQFNYIPCYDFEHNSISFLSVFALVFKYAIICA